MADLALGVVMETMLNTVVSLAAEQITLAWGVDKELKKLAEKLEMIQALLSDAQSKQLTSHSVQLWLKKLGSVALDAQIVLDEFGYEILRQKVDCRKRDKVRSFFSSSNPVVHRPKIARKIKDVMSSIEGVFAESNQIGLREVINLPPPHLKEKRSTEPFVDDSEIVGRDDDTSEVINMLVGSDNQSKLPVIAILGMGGGGKTTLAQLVYKNDTVQSYFDKRVWVCVSDDFNIERLLAEMLQSLTETNHQLTNVEALVGKLKEELSGKRYLLVLDDVWDEKGEKWDRMRRCLLEIGGSKESKVLITTRGEVVAKTMQTSKHHRLQVLSEEQSWKLFEKWAFADGGAKKSPELVDIGKRILKRCGGVPLAIRVMGGLLYSKNCESEWSMIERSELSSDSGEGNRVLSAIKLSYDHLPSLALKQCFAYCAIFQKDTWMQKDELIQLWLAQGLLNPAKGIHHLQMEDIGSEYFYILLRSSLLENVEMVGYGNTQYYKMHDLVHDVSLQVSENYCFHVKDWKDVQDEIKAVHLSIIASEGGLSKSLKDIVPSKLRTLHLEGCYVLEDLFENFKYVTVLILKDEDEKITELPNSISKMKHLRFLDISSCWMIRRLPRSFTDLYYLQTLKVCKLDKVPKGFWKLINLRHFHVHHFHEFSVPEYLIPRLSELTNLQSLPFFKVDKCNGCQIEELEHLDNLKGVLRIYCLQNVSTRESALKSNMSKKSEVQTLYLHWDAEREEDCDDSDVMEGLKPHSNLKSLTLDGYQSPKFPSWMTARNDLRLLGNLVKLSLNQLNKCEQLPSLGDLPCLEHLEISGLDNVRCIGEEFYGWSNLDWVKKSNCSNGLQITLFPSLKAFKLSEMWNLVEWSDAIVRAHAHAHSPVKVFPVLEEMDIYDLPELCSFPNLGCLPKLRRLYIAHCRRLTLPSNWNEFGSLPKSEIEDERAALTHDSYVFSSSEGPSSSSSCPPHHDFLVNAPNVHYLPSLGEDVFAATLCRRNDLKLLGNLVELILGDLKKCEQLPSLGDLPCLEHLDISGLDNVRCIGEEFYGWSNLDGVKKSNCSNGSQITLFPSLKAFKLWGMTNLVEWSDAIVPAHAHSSVKVFPVLEEMDIYDLPGLCSFPNLGCLPKLQRLSIRDCGGLTLPSNWNEVGSLGKSEIEDERAVDLTHDSCVVSSSEGPSASSSSCPHHRLLVKVSNIHYLPSLRSVIIENCDEFAAPFCSLKILAPLEDLGIWCNPSLWPKDLHHLINLRSLELGGNSLDSYGEVDCFSFPGSISNVTEDVQYFPFLTALKLDGHGLPNVTSLSDQIQYLTSLRDLEIWYFDRLEALPEWLGNLRSLQNLTVGGCTNLKQLPSAEAFLCLTNLQCLRIDGCSNLKEACTQGSGSEWPKIALIPNLEVRDGN